MIQALVNPSSAGVRLRRVGRLARRRMRIDVHALSNGVHTDGQLTVEISGLDTAGGVPATFDWRADRPIALVIVRSGVDGDDVTFHVGPVQPGTGSSRVAAGGGFRYVAFCYDVEIARAAPDVREARRRFDLRPALGQLARSGSPA